MGWAVTVGIVMEVDGKVEKVKELGEVSD